MWQYHRGEPNDILTNSESFKFKINITEKAPADNNTNNVKIAVPLKYLRNFGRTLEMSLINYEVNLILTWSENCVMSSATGKAKFAIINAKFYVPVGTLSTQDNAKLHQQLKPGFKWTNNWNKCQ